MKREGDEYVLSTGMRFYAYSGVLGLGDEDGRIRYGYDGILGETREQYFTPAERAEIADEMIGRWKAFKGLCRCAEMDTSYVRPLCQIHPDYERFSDE